MSFDICSKVFLLIGLPESFYHIFQECAHYISLLCLEKIAHVSLLHRRYLT